MESNQVRLDDGHATIITFANAPTVKLFEKDVTPPGMTAGGAIDTTTMRNTEWRTNAPKKLKTLTAVTATVAFATDAIPVMFAQIGVLQPINIMYPDHAQLDFWGWLDEFTPGAFTEGEQPTATITVQPSNRDAGGAESAPVYSNPVGTSGSAP